MVEKLFLKRDQTIDLDKVRVVMDIGKILIMATGIAVACKFYYSCESHVLSDWVLRDHTIWAGKTSELNTPENLQKYGWRPADPYAGR